MDPVCAAWRAIAELPLRLADHRPQDELPIHPLQRWLRRLADLLDLEGVGLYLADDDGYARAAHAGHGNAPERLEADDFASSVRRAWRGIEGAWAFPHDNPFIGGLALAARANATAGRRADLVQLGAAAAAQAAAWLALAASPADTRAIPYHMRENLLCHRLKDRLSPGCSMRSLYPVKVGWHLWRRPEAGGDFLDLLPGLDGRGWFLIGECSGWGGSVAADLAQLVVRARGDWARRFGLVESVRHLNAHLLEEAHRGRLVSLCMGEVDPVRGSLELVRQGSTAAFYRAPGEGSAWRDLTADGGAPLGVLGEPHVSGHRLEWKPGAALVCATDGLYAHPRADGGSHQRGDLQAWLEKEHAETRADRPFPGDSTSSGSLAGHIARHAQPVVEEGVPLDEFTLLSLEA